jgi:gas vesicle protein
MMLLKSSKTKNMSTGKAVLAVLAGIAAGAAIGVIFAPEKGSGAKKNLSKKGEDFANALNATIDDKFEQLMSSLNARVKAKTRNGEPFSSKSEFAE